MPPDAVVPKCKKTILFAKKIRLTCGTIPVIISSFNGSFGTKFGKLIGGGGGSAGLTPPLKCIGTN
jgi:hypothetical protein